MVFSTYSLLMRNSVCSRFNRPVLIVESIHPEEHGFLHMARARSSVTRCVEIFPVGFSRVTQEISLASTSENGTTGSSAASGR